MSMRDDVLARGAAAGALPFGHAGHRSSAGRSIAAPRALDTGITFWLAMFAASAFGTNLGDAWVDGIGLGRTASAASLICICVLAIGGDRRFGMRTELCYWTAVVVLRAAATNLADFITHDLQLGYAAASAVLGACALAMAATTRPAAPGSASPLIERRYWAAMLLAGLFGTTGGDLASRELGLFPAAALLPGLLGLLLAARVRWLGVAPVAYWCAILAERCAATPFSDAFASRHALGLGLLRAMACTLSMLIAMLVWRRRIRAAVGISGRR